MLRNIVSNIRNVSVTPIWPCVNSKLEVYCDKSLHGHWTCKTDFRYGVVNNGPSNIRKCVEPTGTHAAGTERTTKHWRGSCSPNSVRIFNIYMYIYISNYVCCMIRCFVIIILENICLRVRSHVRFVRNPHGLLHFWLVTFQQEWSHGVHCSPANQAKKLPQPRCQKLRLKRDLAKHPLDYMQHNRFPWKRSGRRSSMWPPYSLRRNLSAAACRPCDRSFIQQITPSWTFTVSKV